MYNAPIELTEKQKKWLTAHFKHTKNAECAAKLGISESSLHRIARKMGLKKTKQFIRKAQQAAISAAYASNLANGTFPPKGFIIPGSEKNRFKKGLSPKERWGEKKEAERIQKASATLKEIRKKEQRRVLFGLPQKTKLKVVKSSKERIEQRWYLRKRGYIIDEDKRIAYWNVATLRSPRIEARSTNPYKFAELPANLNS